MSARTWSGRRPCGLPSRRRWGGTVAGPVGWPYVGAVVVPCAQAAEADKASKETPKMILFISRSFDLCEAFLCGTRLYVWQNTLMMQIVPSVEWRLCRIVTAMWWWRHTSGTRRESLLLSLANRRPTRGVAFFRIGALDGVCASRA